MGSIDGGGQTVRCVRSQALGHGEEGENRRDTARPERRTQAPAQPRRAPPHLLPAIGESDRLSFTEPGQPALLLERAGLSNEVVLCSHSIVFSSALSPSAPHSAQPWACFCTSVYCRISRL